MSPVVTSPVATSSPFLPLSKRSSRIARAAGSIVRAVVGFARAVAHRQDVKHMLELDDRALKDIGLVRGDVLGALEAPLGRDPSVLLRLRTVERRALRRPHAVPARRVSPADCEA